MFEKLLAARTVRRRDCDSVERRMKAIVRRLQQLESRAMFPAVGAPRNTIRVVVQPVCGNVDLALPNAGGCLARTGS